MSEAKKEEVSSKPLLCGCGGELRYSHFKDGQEVMSCNKYAVCLTYDEQRDKLAEVTSQMLRYQQGLDRIVAVYAMDYEYRAWAKEALGR